MPNKLCATSDPALHMCTIASNVAMDGMETFERECKDVWEASYRGWTRRLKFSSLAAVIAAFAFSIEEDNKFNESGPAGLGSFQGLVDK